LARAYRKQSNIVLALDVADETRALEILTSVADKIVAVKLHLDIMSPHGSAEFFNKVQEIARKHDIAVINDRKLFDIPAIMQSQVRATPDCLTTIHSLVDIQALQSMRSYNVIPVFGMSADYPVYDYVVANTDIASFVARAFGATGVVCQARGIAAMDQWGDPTQPPAITLTPGIALTAGTDGQQQTWRAAPDKPIAWGSPEFGMFWIVGRAILQTPDIVAATEEYRRRGFAWLLQY
jgi:orotidine-5'-phosphate decarboxylase